MHKIGFTKIAGALAFSTMLLASETMAQPITYYRDSDGDNFGDPSVTVSWWPTRGRLRTSLLPRQGPLPFAP